MDNIIKIKLIERTLIDDLKRPQLTARERVEMLKEYKETTGKTYTQMEHELGLSAGTINEYVKLIDTNYSTITEMRRKLNSGKFNFYKCINDLYVYSVRNKDIPINNNIKNKIKIIIPRLKKIIGDGL